MVAISGNRSFQEQKEILPNTWAELFVVGMVIREFSISVVRGWHGGFEEFVVVVRRAHGGDGGDGGDEDVGEYGGRRRVRGIRRAGHPVGSWETEVRGFGDQKVRGEEQRLVSAVCQQNDCGIGERSG